MPDGMGRTAVRVHDRDRRRRRIVVVVGGDPRAQACDRDLPRRDGGCVVRRFRGQPSTCRSATTPGRMVDFESPQTTWVLEHEVSPDAHDESRVRGVLDGLAPGEHRVETPRRPGPLDRENESGNRRRDDPEPACHDRRPPKNAEPLLRLDAGSSAETPEMLQGEFQAVIVGRIEGQWLARGIPSIPDPPPSSISDRSAPGSGTSSLSITSRSSCSMSES
jgi:hypothetical protein